jgi:hypothetical protein
MTTLYPLKFFNRSFAQQQLMQANPGSVLDITMNPGLLIPACSECGPDGVIREEKSDTTTSGDSVVQTRYRCVVCGVRSDWGARDIVAQQWADMNSTPLPTN